MVDLIHILRTFHSQLLFYVVENKGEGSSIDDTHHGCMYWAEWRPNLVECSTMFLISKPAETCVIYVVGLAGVWDLLVG